MLRGNSQQSTTLRVPFSYISKVLLNKKKKIYDYHNSRIRLLEFQNFNCLLPLLIFCLSEVCYAFYQVIAESLSEEEIAGLKEMFQAMDTDNSGAITFDELKAGLRRYGSNLKESEIRALMNAVSFFWKSS